MTAAKTYSEQDVTRGLMALIAWAGNASAATRALKASGELECASKTLTHWARELHADRYAELRDKYKEQLEEQIVGENRDIIRLAQETVRQALQRSIERLERGEDQNPSRTAADAANVADRSTRDLLALTGRPTSIREDRNLEQVMRSLVSKGIIQVPEQPALMEAQEA